MYSKTIFADFFLQVFFIITGMSEDRSRSPYIDNARFNQTQQSDSRDRSRSPRSYREDSYSASLRLASLETLTGKTGSWVDQTGQWRENEKMRESEKFYAKMSSSSTSTTVPSSTAEGGPNPLHLLAGLPGSPFSHLLNGGGVSGLPKPADLIQQAQALQLLAHLQTVLLNPASSPSSLNQFINNRTDIQKVMI